MKIKKTLVLISLVSACLIIGINRLSAQETSKQDTKFVKIAVRAHSGTDAAFNKWSSTADYLTHSIDGYTFQLIPLLSFDEMQEVVAKNEVDFVLTNPTAYIDLSINYGISRITTLINGRNGKGDTEFSSVVFVKANETRISFLKDIEDKSIMGVHEKAFGGWQMVYRELLEIDIDPYSDCSDVLFSPNGTQEQIVFEVLKNNVDVGIVRTGIIENLVKEGKIKMQEIKVIGAQNDNFPYVHTTRLYPEWPFSMLKNTDELLAKKVSITLLQMGKYNKAAINGEYTGWKVPLSYNSVLELLKIIKVSPFQGYGKMTLFELIKLYSEWFIIGLAFIIILSIILIMNRIANIRLISYKGFLEQKVTERTAELKASNLELKKHRNNLEAKVKKRTEEIETINEELKSSNEELIISNEKLNKANKELEEFNDLFIGREFRIKELRDKIKILEGK